MHGLVSVSKHYYLRSFTFKIAAIENILNETGRPVNFYFRNFTVILICKNEFKDLKEYGV
jgi:hypothetical protein